jgi:hypothetical protein
MSYNGSGTFNINTAGQPVVTGTTITSTAFNLLTADLATGLSTALTKDGQTTPTANIPMGSFKITGLGAGTAATDAAQYGQLQAGATTIATVTGTDTYVGTLSPAIAAYATGNLFSFVAPNTNTGAATINLNSLGTKNITKLGSTALAAGDIVSGRVYQIEYDGTRFQLLNPSASTVASFSAGSTGFTPSSATTGAVTLAGTLATTNGGTGLTSFTANQVFYASSTSAFAQSSNLQFSGTDLTVYGLTVGRGAGAVSTNTAVGASALSGNSSGAESTAIGFEALKVSTASNNTAVGSYAGRANTSGTANSFFGNGAGISNTTGSYNTAIGRSALETQTTASFNTAVGYQAAYNNTTASDTTAVGYQSLLANTTGGDNSAFGLWALKSNTTGGSNTSVGAMALFSNTTAANNTAVGYQAAYSNTTGDAIVGIGRGALYSNSTGYYNTATGYNTSYSNTSGIENVSNGFIALSANTTGSYNTAIGSRALSSNTTGQYNTAVGQNAGYTNDGGQYNVYVGNGAGNGATSDRCVFVGAYAGNVSTGTQNTFVGQDAGSVMTSGTRNTIIGRYTGNLGGLDFRTQSNFVVLSDGDGNWGYRWSNSGGSYQQNNSASWSTTSDARVKENIVSLSSGLDKILALRPVEFDYKIFAKQHEVGFIAQEYQQVLPDQVTSEPPSNKEIFVMTGGEQLLGIQQNLTPYFVKAIQEQQAIILSLKARLDAANL